MLKNVSVPFSIKNISFATFILLLSAALSFFWSMYFERAILATPYEIGYREGAPQVITQMLIDGDNFSTFEYQPLGYNAYGVSYNFAVLPFALIFGNTLHIHRWVTFIFILLSTATGFWVVFQQRRSFALALICSAFIMIAFMGWGGVGSAPSTMGTFLFLAAIFIPYLRSFDNTGIILSAVLAVIAFHTKAYFVLSFGIVAAYLFLFISKKKAIGYGVIFLMLFAAAFAVIRINYPLYFVNTIRGNASNTFRTFKHLYTQLFWLTVYFLPILGLTGLMLWKIPGSKQKAMEKTRIKFDLWNLNNPFFDLRPDFFLHTFIISLLAFLIVLGSHVGNYLAYSYELVVPTFLFWFFINFDQKRTFTILPAFAIVINLFYWQYITLNPQMLTQRSSVEWKKAFSYLDPSLNILNSPTLTSRMIELGMTPVDSGQTDVYYLMDPYPDNSLIGPSYQEYYNDGVAYTNSINESIAKQEYDLIIITKDVDVFYDLELIKENYEMVDQLILYMSATEQKWVVQIWEPK
ncbi:hypothetical protein MASR2M66_12220 [Chloroflexota bacterium]